jgi:hypothetical protein
VIEQGADGWDQLVLWRHARAGVNVLGVEPSTARDFDRETAERAGAVILLEPGQARAHL